MKTIILNIEIYIYIFIIFIYIFLQNTTLWRWLFSQCSSLLTNLLSMRWRYSYLRIKYRRILSHHAPHHSSRHRIDIAMSPASRTEVPRGGGRPPPKKQLEALIGGRTIIFCRPPPGNGEHTEESERKMRKEME